MESIFKVEFYRRFRKDPLIYQHGKNHFPELSQKRTTFFLSQEATDEEIH